MDDVMGLFQRLQSELEGICIRGVQSVSAEEIRWLDDTQDRLAAAGAGYLASVVQRFVESLQNAPRQSPARLLELLTVVRVFERVETLDAAHSVLAHLKEVAMEQESRPWT